MSVDWRCSDLGSSISIKYVNIQMETRRRIGSGELCMFVDKLILSLKIIDKYKYLNIFS